MFQFMTVLDSAMGENRVSCWSCALMSLPQSSPDLPIYQCRPDSFLPGTSKHRCYYFWRKLVVAPRCQETTGRSPICRLSRKYWSGLYWHVCALTSSRHPISVGKEPTVHRDHARGWHGNGESGNTAVTTTITAGRENFHGITVGTVNMMR